MKERRLGYSKRNWNSLMRNAMVRTSYRAYFDKKIWYHATTAEALPYLEKGIDPEYNKGTELDFGYGFYLTSSLEEAKKFGLKIKEATENWGESSKERRPVVVEYAIPLSVNEAIAQNYKVKVFDQADAEFYDFVFHNRTKNAYGIEQHDYDMVFGDMSNANPMELVAAWKADVLTEEEVKKSMGTFKSFKQLSIHKQSICDKINKIKVYDAETGRELS